MNRVKVIRCDIESERDFGAYQKFLEMFMQQDIKVVTMAKESISKGISPTLGNNKGNWMLVTIIYECKDDFVDETGASTVELMTNELSKGEFELEILDYEDDIVKISRY